MLQKNVRPLINLILNFASGQVETESSMNWCLFTKATVVRNFE